MRLLALIRNDDLDSQDWLLLSPPKFSVGGLNFLRFPISLGGRVSEAKGWKLGNDEDYQ